MVVGEGFLLSGSRLVNLMELASYCLSSVLVFLLLLLSFLRFGSDLTLDTFISAILHVIDKLKQCTYYTS